MVMLIARKKKKMNIDKDIVDYYVAQVGGGNGIYSGALYQRGQGVGGFLASLFRSVIPILRRRGLAIGKTLLSTGSELLGDLQNDVGLKSSFQNRKQDTFEKLKKNLITGEGYKKARKRKLCQSQSESVAKHTTKKKKTLVKKTPGRKKKTTKRIKNLKKKIKDFLS
jgi:hypothetical protein